MVYANPVGSGLTQGRVDQGVDYSGSGPLYALGSGTIVNTTNSGWPNNTFVVLKLDQPVNGQQYIYYAEDLTPSVKVGQKVTAGQQIGQANGGGNGIELGYASSNLGQAASAGQFTGSNATPLGQDFLSFIENLGSAAGRGSGGSGTGTSGGDTTPSTGTATGTAPDPGSAPGGIVGFAESIPLMGSLFSAIEPLLHAVATVIDYSFGVFEPGQGQRFLFIAGAIVLLFLSYKALASAGAVPEGLVPKVVPVL